MAYGFTNVRNMAGGLEAWSGELQVPTVPPITVEVSAINDRSPGPYDVRIDGEDVTVELQKNAVQDAAGKHIRI
jgi:copper chaperone CopZ